nr:pyrroline-5-carboxylate reductase dimerization domain-containing protein [Methanogenium sp. MK-MG]
MKRREQKKKRVRERMDTQIGIIGTGSMGCMLIRSFIRGGAAVPRNISASNRTPEAQNAIATETGIQTADNNRTLARDSDVIILCVRQPDVVPVMEEIHDLLTDDKLLISVASDVALSELEALTPARVVRVIPSVTSEQLKGVSLIVFSERTTPADREQALSLFGAVGTPVVISEQDIEPYTTLTSCAPAFFAAMVREFAKSATRMTGIPAAEAETLARETFIGTAALLEVPGTGCTDIISRVATPGGITEEGVNVLTRDFPAVCDEIFAATARKHAHFRDQSFGE